MILVILGLESWELALIVWAGVEILVGLLGFAIDQTEKARLNPPACEVGYYRASEGGQCQPVSASATSPGPVPAPVAAAPAPVPTVPFIVKPTDPCGALATAEVRGCLEARGR